jgi:hypothetical protein
MTPDLNTQTFAGTRWLGLTPAPPRPGVNLDEEHSAVGGGCEGRQGRLPPAARDASPMGNLRRGQPWKEHPRKEHRS